MGSDRRSLRTTIRFAMKVVRWSCTGLGAPRRSLRRGHPRSTTMRSIGFGSGKDSTVTSNSSKIVRAVPKAETQQDVKSGVQKLRVKLLSESSSEHHGCSLPGTTMSFSE
uniref:Uncharacterized protein n=1 Tax=Quercus lobata TaxID=97700 RepID=A0A7N2KNJ5_QUELO